MNTNNLPDALLKGISKLERNGFRVVRIVPTEPAYGGGYVAFLSKRLRNGLRLAQVEIDDAGNVQIHH